jgi:phenolic acid decarboxylase
LQENSISKLKFDFIAVDFDNTITTSHVLDFELTEIREHTIRVINKIVEHGGRVAIWTCRSNEQQDLVEKILKKHGISYHVINESFPEFIEMFGGQSRKILASTYIDDRCLWLQGNNKEVDWLEVEKLLFT